MKTACLALEMYVHNTVTRRTLIITIANVEYRGFAQIAWGMQSSVGVGMACREDSRTMP